MKGDSNCTICFGRGWLIVNGRAEGCDRTITAKQARGIDSAEGGETLAARPEGQEPGPKDAPKKVEVREDVVQRIASEVWDWCIRSTGDEDLKRRIRTALQGSAQDAARWQWLIANHPVTLLTLIFGNGCVNRTIEGAIAEIDAAMQGSAPPEGEQ